MHKMFGDSIHSECDSTRYVRPQILSEISIFNSYESCDLFIHLYMTWCSAITMTDHVYVILPATASKTSSWQRAAFNIASSMITIEFLLIYMYLNAIFLSQLVSTEDFQFNSFVIFKYKNYLRLLHIFIYNFSQTHAEPCQIITSFTKI